MKRTRTPCPIAGAGVHSWLLAESNRFRAAGLPSDEAERLLAEEMSRPPNPPNEVKTAVAKAYAQRPLATRSRTVTAPIPLTTLAYDSAKLERFASQITPPPSWRHWLWERSAKRPEAMNAYSFLLNLYQPGEKVLIFDAMGSKTPLATVAITDPLDCSVPEIIRTGGQGQGIWFLSNPVDGEFHQNPRTKSPSPSCRSEEAITCFRYAVLESDQAPADLWLAFIVQLPMKISAIYTSGGRSIHTLIRIDGVTKSDWDAAVMPLKRPLRVLGADSAALSAVRLTRLPGCHRPEKSGYQRLLYLNPNPSEKTLWSQAPIHSRPWTLARWRRDCPRWNSAMEAFS